MKTRTTITLSEWMKDEIIGKTDNLSGRIQELIMKGWMHEKTCKHSHNNSEKKEQDVVSGISSRDSHYVDGLPIDVNVFDYERLVEVGELVEVGDEA